MFDSLGIREVPVSQQCSDYSWNIHVWEFTSFGGKKALAQIQKPPKRLRLTKEQARAQRAEEEGLDGNDKTLQIREWQTLLRDVEREAIWNYWALFNNEYATRLTEEFLPGVAVTENKYKAVREKCLTTARNCQYQLLENAIVSRDRLLFFEFG